MKRWLLAATFGVVALGLLLYPLVGELLSEKYHSDVETAYTAAIEDSNADELEQQRQAAQQYNAMLSGAATITEGGASAPPLAYAQQLTVGGVMAYVDIPKINVYLPVQHGTDADTLERAVGHVVGTSLPVGGSSTHAVLSAHSGLASSKLFSDIDQLAADDMFYIHVLGEVLAYKVDAINTVLPTWMSRASAKCWVTAMCGSRCKPMFMCPCATSSRRCRASVFFPFAAGTLRRQKFRQAKKKPLCGKAQRRRFPK